MDEQTAKEMSAARLSNQRRELEWVMEMIMSDFSIDEIMNALMKRERAYRKEEEYGKTEIRTTNHT